MCVWNGSTWGHTIHVTSCGMRGIFSFGILASRSLVYCWICCPVEVVGVFVGSRKVHSKETGGRHLVLWWLICGLLIAQDHCLQGVLEKKSRVFRLGCEGGERLQLERCFRMFGVIIRFGGSKIFSRRCLDVNLTGCDIVTMTAWNWMMNHRQWSQRPDLSK